MILDELNFQSVLVLPNWPYKLCWRAIRLRVWDAGFDQKNFLEVNKNPIQVDEVPLGDALAIDLRQSTVRSTIVYFKPENYRKPE